MPEITNPFKQPFLSTFFLSLKTLPLGEDVLKKADATLVGYEKSQIDWHLEKILRQRNDLLVSFAVSKAENSSLTLAEATEVYNLVEGEIVANGPAFLAGKLKAKEKLTKKDHDRLEYYNIAKTFRSLSKEGIKVKNLSSKFVLELHEKLTANLDIFAGVLVDFETYRSGKFRNDDKTRVADYQPAPHVEIKASIDELIKWFKKQPTATNIFIFHAALYALHPFKNGNKRVCRVLEHFLLQDIGYNQKNLYSSSYYYHKHQERYYKNLVEALYKRNLNYFVSFASEALFFSIAGVITSVLQRKKSQFLDSSGLEKDVVKALRPLVKRRELQFGRFYALAKRKVAKQTFVNYLAQAVEKEVITRREQGKNVYYSLKGNYPEESLLKNGLPPVREQLNYLPEEFVGYL